MKYVLFIIAALGVPPLAFLFYMNRGWMRYAVWGMLAAMCLYHNTAINFFSDEFYRGSSRGMEVSVIHLLAFALILALIACRRFKGWFPETGFWLYAIYFLLCLPSLKTAADGMIAWYEIWKMIMLYLVYLAVYSYLNATGNVRAVLSGIAVFVIFNMLVVVKDHFSGSYQPHGVFPHQNSLAMAMHLFGTLFFAFYVMNGIRGRTGKLFAVAALLAIAATARSYSRLALALMPMAYGIACLACFVKGRPRAFWRRLVPFLVIGLMGFAVMLPRIVERFLHAPQSSGDTRVELARCAWEMIKDEPVRGVGINNWGIKINSPYPYAELAERNTNRGAEFRDGIVETVYLLVCAECGIPALVAMLCWFLWYWLSCLRLLGRLKGTKLFFIPAGLLGGLAADYVQSCFEWVLRQQLNIICLMFVFALISYLNVNWMKIRKLELEEKGDTLK